MKKHENTKGNRKWVIKAMIGFIAVLAVLTFFSNTIMNATIPLVMTSNAMRGNLSYTNSATGQLVSDNQIEVKGLEGRTVERVIGSNYDLVSEGDVILTLQPVENMSELTDLEQQLATLQQQQETALMTPNHGPDFTTQNQAVRTAERALADAQTTLNSATTRDETIAAAQQVLSANQAAVTALQAQVASASASVEYINTQLAALYARLAVIDGTANVVIPTVPPLSSAPHPAGSKNDPSDPASPDTSSDPNAAPSETSAPTSDTSSLASSETSATTTTQAPATVPSETLAPSEDPATNPTSAAPTPVPATISDNSTDRATIMNQIAQLQGQLTDAQNRLTGYSSQLAAAQAAVTAAQNAITQAEALPSTYAAQDAVTDAQAALNSAQIALSDAQLNASRQALTDRYAIENRQLQIEQMEDKIAKTRARLEQTEIVAPADGYVFNVAVQAGDKLTEQTVIFTIVPENSTYSVSFTFPANVASSMAVGQQFSSSDYYYIDNIVITNIKPDPANPRGNRIVKCAVTGSGQLWPGESITVTADRGNSTYDHVVAASAVSEDNSGSFVFVVDKSSGPLGDRYVVRRVSVTVEARSGAFAAITGEGLDGAMVVTRSDVPLHNGDRVRLEDFSSNQT